MCRLVSDENANFTSTVDYNKRFIELCEHYQITSETGAQYNLDHVTDIPFPVRSDVPSGEQ